MNQHALIIAPSTPTPTIGALRAPDPAALGEGAKRVYVTKPAEAVLDDIVKGCLGGTPGLLCAKMIRVGLSDAARGDHVPWQDVRDTLRAFVPSVVAQWLSPEEQAPKYNQRTARFHSPDGTYEDAPVLEIDPVPDHEREQRIREVRSQAARVIHVLSHPLPLENASDPIVLFPAGSAEIPFELSLAVATYLNEQRLLVE